MSLEADVAQRLVASIHHIGPERWTTPLCSPGVINLTETLSAISTELNEMDLNHQEVITKIECLHTLANHSYTDLKYNAEHVLQQKDQLEDDIRQLSSLDNSVKTTDTSCIQHLLDREDDIDFLNRKADNLHQRLVKSSNELDAVISAQVRLVRALNGHFTSVTSDKDT
ncbi:hypothetical protein P9112_003048 [Eukaryota sp. TZLM1-RC]